MTSTLAVQNGHRVRDSFAKLKLGAAALTTQSQLNSYSAQIEAHAKAIVKLNKVLDKLDRLLSQRKLNDFEDSDTRSEAQNRYKSGSHEE